MLNKTAPTFLPFLLVANLAFVGGFADAGSFVLLGVFSGHLTGNSILSGINIVEGSFSQLWITLTALGGFVGGTVLGVLWRRSIRTAVGMSVPLLTEFIIVLLGILTYDYLNPISQDYVLAICLSLSLGIQNGVYTKISKSQVHTTYITGVTTSLLATIFYTQDDIPKKAYDRSMFITVSSTFLLGAVTGAFLTYHYKTEGLLPLVALLLSSAALCNWFFSTDNPNGMLQK